MAKDETWDFSSIDNECDPGITPVCDIPSITKVKLVGDVSNYVDNAVSSGLDLAVETIAKVAFPSTASLTTSSSTITIKKELRAGVNVADEKTEAGNVVNLFEVVSTKCDRPVNKRHKSILGGFLD